MMRMFLSTAVIVVATSVATNLLAQTPGADTSLPPDLWTRKTGSDWASFLGPTFDGKSSETGFQRWNEEGPKRLWQQKLGTGYGPPAVSRGRLFLFDRYGDQARLTCQKAETME